MATENNDICGTQALRPTTDSQRAFSVEEFCRRFGVGRTKVYEELGLGRLRARKVGRRTIITEDDAEDWLRRLPLMKSTDGHGEVVS
jgi:excisionase family DNA binding protein